MVLFSVYLFTVLPKTSLGNKDFFNDLYSPHLILPVYTSYSFPRPWESLIELVKKNQDRIRGPSLQTPWETVTAERTMPLKIYETEVGRYCRGSTTMWYALK